MEYRPTGITFEALRAHPELLEQTRPGEHVWITIASWRIDGEKVLAAHRGVEVTLHWDAENLADFSVGCYVCEQEFSERTYHRKCPGEPRL